MNDVAFIIGWVVMGLAGATAVAGAAWFMLDQFYRHFVIAEDFIRVWMRYKTEQRANAEKLPTVEEMTRGLDG